MSANPFSLSQPRQFIEIAKPLIERGIPVIPLRPFSKRGLFENQFEMATTDINIVTQWNSENPSYNVGCVGTPDGYVILDSDNPELIARIECETGRKMPRTFTVKSAGKGLPHLYFRQTEMSRAIGNKKASEQFDLQSVNKYVVGPGSTLDDGRRWEVIDDSPIADFPDWLAYWILDNCDQKHTSEGLDKAPSVHEDFDFDEFCDHYDIDYFGDGSGGKYILRACPVKGCCHTTDGDPDYAACVIFYDGDKLGFSDLATSCEGSNLSIGGLIRWMNTHGHEPYRGVIWPQDTSDLLNDPRFLVEDAALSEIPVQDSVTSDDKAVASTVQSPTTDNTNSMDEAWVEHAKAINPDPLPVPDDLDAILFAEPATGVAFDERALYGKLGEMARATELPLGWMYPTMLATASALDIRDKDGHVRPNMFVANLAPVGNAKTVVVDAALESIFLPPDRAKELTPSSDRGLAHIVGEEGNTTLLVCDEFRAVLSKCQIPNSTLAQVFNTLWNKDKTGGSDKKGIAKCIGKLCVIGNIACDDPTDFAKTFGNSTVTGMYSRFLYGYDTKLVQYEPREHKREFFNDEMVVLIPKWAWKAKNRWEGTDGKRTRMGEHALRIALVTAAINGDKEVTPPCLAAAFRFMEWQERVRTKFKPGLAETKEAEALEAIYNALLEQTHVQERTQTFPKGADSIADGKKDAIKMLNFTDVVKAKNLYRKYSSLITRVKNTMLDDGIIERIKEVEVDKEGNEKSKKDTPFYVLNKSL
jgi:hypothetical protein